MCLRLLTSRWCDRIYILCRFWNQKSYISSTSSQLPWSTTSPSSLADLMAAVKSARKEKRATSIGFHGNIVDVSTKAYSWRWWLWIPDDDDDDYYYSNRIGFNVNIADVSIFMKIMMGDLLMVLMIMIMIGIIILSFPRFGRSSWGSTNALVSCWSNLDQVPLLAIIVVAVTITT